jgi:serine acetyltransferase
MESARVQPGPSETFLLTAKKIAKVVSDPALAFALLNAQLQMRGRARVPLSVRLHGKVHIKGGGDISIGDGTTLTGTVVPLEFVVHDDAHLIIGDHTFLNYGSSISAHQRVEIGDHCLIGHYALILDNDHHDLGKHHVLPISAPVVIEDHVWIGSKVTILPGVRVGRYSAIGAGSVVTRDIPSHCLAVGSPARVIRRLDQGNNLLAPDAVAARPSVPTAAV